MSLISMHGAWLSFSDAPLLDNAELHIEDNERVCLVGRNGAGKSTLMKILNREQGLDDGRIIYEQDLIVARLQQDPPRNVAGTVYDFVAEGIAEQAAYLKAYHDVSHQVMTDPSDKNLNELARLQEQLDNLGLWQLDSRINEVIEQLGLDANAQLASLSGGWLRKAALGRALVSGPRVLLLDEPTNHLDIETIDWLEGFLKTFKGTIIFISHDRSFIRNMATRIVDLDRGKLVTYPGNYDQYLLDKEEALRVEELQNAEFDRKLAQEEVWIRQGIKARRTRNEGRVRALKAMRRERGERREVMGSAKMQVEEASRSGKIVFEMENVNYQVDGKVLVKDFSAQIQRGDKIALIGPNGCGKTTLLKLMLGQLQADSGRIHVGTKLEVAYFDQHRAELDPDKTVMDNLAEGKQEVMVNGKPRHVLGYLQDFLFHPKRAMTPVRALSGGERNRLLLARLFLKPSNLLILDEPTLRVVYAPSQYFASEPKADISLVLRNPQAMDSARRQVMFALNDYLAGIALDQLSNQAAVGGISFSTGANNGLMVNANGYTQHLPALFSDLLQGYFSYTPTEEQLEQAKSWYAQMMDSAEKGKAYDQAIMPIQMVSQVPYFQREVRRALLPSITLKEVLDYRANLKTRGRPELMVIGNMTADAATTLARQIQQQLGADGNEWCRNKDVVVNRQQLAIFNKAGNSTDSALAAVFAPPNVDEFSSTAASTLLGQIIQPWFYNQLRTEEQLGYAVFAFPMNVGRQWGMGFLLQSSDKQPAFLWQRFQAFFPTAEAKLRAMKPEEFAQLQQAVISQMLQAPQTLGDEASKLSKDFDRGNMRFDSRDKVVAQIKLLTPQKLADFFHQTVVDPQGMTILSQISGSQNGKADYAQPKGGKVWENVSALQQSLPLMRENE